MGIVFLSGTEDIHSSQLQGFFVGWPDPPTPETHLGLLQNSAEVVLALGQDTNKVVGFVSAITDRVLTAYIPLLEVLPAYQKRGIGQELMCRMRMQLDGFYMIDLSCDAPLQPFYKAVGMEPAIGMLKRNYARQSGDVNGREG